MYGLPSEIVNIWSNELHAVEMVVFLGGNFLKLNAADKLWIIGGDFAPFV